MSLNTQLPSSTAYIERERRDQNHFWGWDIWVICVPGLKSNKVRNSKEGEKTQPHGGGKITVAPFAERHMGKQAGSTMIMPLPQNKLCLFWGSGMTNQIESGSRGHATTQV